jgi:hypothetical protein
MQRLNEPSAFISGPYPLSYLILIRQSEQKGPLIIDLETDLLRDAPPEICASMLPGRDIVSRPHTPIPPYALRLRPVFR